MRLPAFQHRSAGAALRYALSLATLACLASRVDWARFGGLRGLDWSLATPAVLLAGLAYPLQLWRWQLLLRAQDLHLPGRWIHGVFWLGQFCNSFLPGGVAGDVIRFGYLKRVSPDRSAAAVASLVVDRLLGLAALCALAVLALGLHFMLTGGHTELRPLLAASAAAFVLLLALGWSSTHTRRWEPLSARLLGPKRAATLHDAAVSLGAQHGVLALAALLSVAVWLADFVSLWLLARSVGLAAGPLVMTVVAAAAYVAASLPVSIGGHGVREVALVAMLGLLGFGADAAVAPLAMAFWAVSVGWSLAGGAFYLLAKLAGWMRLPNG